MSAISGNFRPPASPALCCLDTFRMPIPMLQCCKRASPVFVGWCQLGGSGCGILLAHYGHVNTEAKNAPGSSQPPSMSFSLMATELEVL